MENELKLIAVRPLKGCAPHVHKVLKPGVTYFLYNNYKMTDDDQFIQKVENPVPSYFYQKDADAPQLNISAIVGKNGDGKSTLVELIMRVINNFAYFARFDERHGNLDRIKGVYAELYFSIKDIIYKIKTEEKVISVFEDNGNGYKQIWSKMSGKDSGTGDIEPLKQNFFYTMVTNYSLYAYNSNDYVDEWNKHTSEDEEGNETVYFTRWIDKIFHKNDGYQTPLVLHPYRKEGNIEVNNEKILVNSRMMALFFNPGDNEISNFRKVTGKQEACALLYGLMGNDFAEKKSKVLEEWTDYLEINEDEFAKFDVSFRAVEKQILDIWEKKYNALRRDLNLTDNNNSEAHLRAIEYAQIYISYKTLSAVCKYKKYKKYKERIFKTKAGKVPLSSADYNIMFNNQEYNKMLHEMIGEILNDKSHITLKIHQTFVYLCFRQISWTDELESQITDLNKKPALLDLDDYSRTINNILRQSANTYKWNVIHILPPPVFHIDIKLKNTSGNHKDEYCQFSALSSGEKQQAYTVSSILYHLRNINSVEENHTLYKYRHINLIFEEIELYFHPEYQRKFIKYLIDSISNIHLPSVDSINMCFVTHSPFILSDIPINNVLFLEDGYPVYKMQENTFGANIHSLLKNGFFLDTLPIGDFAHEKINRLFEKLNRGIFGPQEFEDMYKEIILVGEPYLRGQLLKLYNSYKTHDGKLSENEMLLRRLMGRYENSIADLTAQIEELKDQINQRQQ